jgi:hypothetical protein
MLERILVTYMLTDHSCIARTKNAKGYNISHATLRVPSATANLYHPGSPALAAAPTSCVTSIDQLLIGFGTLNNDYEPSMTTLVS